MADPLSSAALDQLFRTARTRNAWTDRPVSDAQIRELYELLKWAPTAANGNPARFVWVRSEVGKAKLAALASEGNRTKILTAPLSVIVGNNLDFADHMPQLFPARGEAIKAMFKANEAASDIAAFRNGSLQAGYLILAARALGLDVGPMSGFDNDAVDREFFGGTRIKSNLICCLGYGSDEQLHPRNPRLSFEDAGRFA